MKTKARPSLWKHLFQKPMLVTLLMGLSSGLPFLLTSRTLQAWMTDAKVDLKTVGLLSLIGLPYTLKFIWAPVFDRYVPLRLGRRRSWLLISQVGLGLSLFAMAFVDPALHTWNMAALALWVAFLSASQDSVVDAFRRESLTENDLAIGSTFYIYGYRTAMLISGGGALALAQVTSWQFAYICMAGLVLIAILATLWADEPVASSKIPTTLREVVIEPLREFFNRPLAISMLGFILLYKMGDAIAGNMLTPFYLKMEYSKLEIAAIAKTLSLPITLLGGFLGGVFVYHKGIYRGLWVFGILQMASTATVSVLTMVPHSNWLLGGVILFEDLSQSMATTAFVAFMASLTNRRFTATQYALLASLSGVPRVILASPAGLFVDQVGWVAFFCLCGLAAIPGLAVLLHLQRKGVFAA